MIYETENSTILIRRIETLFGVGYTVVPSEKKSFFSKKKYEVNIDRDKELFFIDKGGKITQVADPKNISMGDSAEEFGTFIVVPKDKRDIVDPWIRGNISRKSEMLFAISGGIPESKELPEDTARIIMEEEVYAVRSDSFDLSFKISLGNNLDGYDCFLKLQGSATIRDLGRFLQEIRSSNSFTKNKFKYSANLFVDRYCKGIENLILEKLRTDLEVTGPTDLADKLQNTSKNKDPWPKALGIGTKEEMQFEGATIDFNVRSADFSCPEGERIAKAIAIAEEKRRKEEEKRRKEEEDKKQRQQDQLDDQDHEIKVAKKKLDLDKINAEREQVINGMKHAPVSEVASILSLVMNLVDKKDSLDPLSLLKAAGRKEVGMNIAALAGKKARTKSGVVEILHGEEFSYQPRRLVKEEKVSQPVLLEKSHYSINIASKRSGFLTLLDIDENNFVCPILPNDEVPNAHISAGKTESVGKADSAWIREHLVEVASSGTETIVAIVAERPLLRPEELVSFGDELPASVAAALLDRLSKLGQDNWDAAVLSFAIKPKK
jgi:hypothetical protein